MKIISKAEDENRKIIYKKFYKQLDEIRELKQNIAEYNDVICKVGEMLKASDVSVYSICEDKNGNKAFVCIQDIRKIQYNYDTCKSWMEGNINIFIVSSLTLPSAGKNYTSMPFLEAEFLDDSVYINELHCDCCKSLYENKGYGTMLIKTVVNLAKYYNCKKICGTLSREDAKTEQKKEKRNRFYQKRGFELKFDDDKQESGSICLNL